MRLSARSYPHPVIGNRDDVPGAAFQATVDVSTDKENVYLDVTTVCSSDVVVDLVNEDAATYAVHVECSNTLFRTVFQFREAIKRLSIPADNLNAVVEVNTFVVATKNISGYRIPDAHTDYGDTSFDIGKGDVLAVAQGYTFDVESNFDSLGRIGSIMQIVESSEDGDRPLLVDMGRDKLTIILSKPDFGVYRLVRGQDAVSGPLTCAIVLPVLVEALRVLVGADGDNDDLRWSRILRRRVSALGRDLTESTDCLEVAQELLELPIRRALASARQLAEAAS